jgi:hypothetical protein
MVSDFVERFHTLIFGPGPGRPGHGWAGARYAADKEKAILIYFYPQKAVCPFGSAQVPTDRVGT